MTDQYRPLKDAFGRFATGIGIAACKKRDGGYSVITINSFTSVSLNPPLVLWCIDKSASVYPDFSAADSYSISILSAQQKEMSERFARYDPMALTGDEIDLWETGAPLLKNRIAGFDCKITMRHAAGDHDILIGEVIRFDSANGAPLVYFASNYHPGVED